MLAYLLLPVSAHASGTKLTVPDSSCDLGAVRAGAQVAHTFTLRNDGPAAITIVSLAPSPGCACALDPPLR